MEFHCLMKEISQKEKSILTKYIANKIFGCVLEKQTNSSASGQKFGDLP